MYRDLLSTAVAFLMKFKNPFITNEHFVPKQGLDLDTYIQKGNRTAVHHLLRYDWAVQVLSDSNQTQKILDVACGSGYGSYLLAQKYKDIQVIGADYDRSALKAAKEAYHLPNLEFRFGDVLLWEDTIGKDTFDCVISFDTIEHINHREIMMQNLVNHLSPSGQMLMSTPCDHNENVLTPRWPFHKLEYSAESLYDFLCRYFGQVVQPNDSSFPHLDVFDVLKGTKIQYSNRLNPVVCRQPVLISNPYHNRS